MATTQCKTLQDSRAGVSGQGFSGRDPALFIPIDATRPRPRGLRRGAAARLMP